MFKPLTLDQCAITLHVEQDDIPVRGNAMASGDDLDKKVEDDILRRLDCGDIWAWADVTVTISFHGLSASDYLGGCSYGSEKNFRESSGYFDDMCAEALTNLNAQLLAIHDAICS